MTRTQKTALGVASVWPMAYLLVTLAVVNVVDVKSIVGPAPPTEGLPVWFIVLLGTYVATALLALAITLFYVWWVFSGGRVPRPRRVPWAAALLLFNILAVVPFFWRYVWRDDGVTAD